MNNEEQIKFKVLQENEKSHDAGAKNHTRSVPYQYRRNTRNYIYKLILNQLKDSKIDIYNCKILEVACGTGTFVKLAEKYNCQYHGIDISNNMIQTAKRNSNYKKATFEKISFLEELSKNYQIIYTTHSPFMIDSNHLDRVYTIYETKDGSIISDSVQQKDANTLFPLQAALGYSIAQNLFVNKNNLVVEGISDLVYLNYMSSLLKENKKEGLNDDIVIVPVGGADKVSAFISLMRGNKLNIVCLLDTFTEQKPKANIENLAKEKIIKQGNLKFYSDFVDNLNIANIEDIFSVKEYLNLFNEEFKEYNDINESDIDKSKTILDSINKIIEKDRFNHYRPAKLLVSKGFPIDYFEQSTLDRFEKIFKEINNIFKKQ